MSRPITVSLVLDRDEMARRGRLGARSLHARHDGREQTKPARMAFLSRFERQVDPDRELPEAERQRLAEEARRSYFSHMASLSARARRAAREGAADA